MNQIIPKYNYLIEFLFYLLAGIYTVQIHLYMHAHMHLVNQNKWGYWPREEAHIPA